MTEITEDEYINIEDDSDKHMNLEYFNDPENTTLKYFVNARDYSEKNMILFNNIHDLAKKYNRLDAFFHICLDKSSPNLRYHIVKKSLSECHNASDNTECITQTEDFIRLFDDIYNLIKNYNSSTDSTFHICLDRCGPYFRYYTIKKCLANACKVNIWTDNNTYIELRSGMSDTQLFKYTSEYLTYCPI